MLNCRPSPDSTMGRGMGSAGSAGRHVPAWRARGPACLFGTLRRQRGVRFGKGRRHAALADWFGRSPRTGRVARVMSADASRSFIFREIQAADPKWRVDVGTRAASQAGSAERISCEPPRGRSTSAARDGGSPGTTIGRRSPRCSRCGLAGRASVAIAPYVTHACVPDVASTILSEIQGRHPVRKVRAASSPRDDAR